MVPSVGLPRQHSDVRKIYFLSNADYTETNKE